MLAPLKSKGSRRTGREPDDAPEITDRWTVETNLRHGKKLVRGGLTDTELARIDRDFKTLRKSRQSR